MRQLRISAVRLSVIAEAEDPTPKKGREKINLEQALGKF